MQIRRALIASGTGDAVVERRVLDCQPVGLKGQRIIDGLASTITETVLRFSLPMAQQRGRSRARTPQRPSVIIPSAQSAVGVSAVYFRQLGVEHILTGADHLLFILASKSAYHHARTLEAG